MDEADLVTFVSIPFSPGVIRKLREAAADTGKSVGDFARDVLMEELAVRAHLRAHLEQLNADPLRPISETLREQ